MDALDKQQAKQKKKLDKEFRAWFKIVRSKLRKCKADKETKVQLIKDLTDCNNLEIMHYLYKEATFKTIEEYIDHVNACILFESRTYDYHLPKYNGSNFAAITKMVKLRHDYLRLKNKIFINT